MALRQLSLFAGKFRAVRTMLIKPNAVLESTFVCRANSGLEATTSSSAETMRETPIGLQELPPEREGPDLLRLGGDHHGTVVEANIPLIGRRELASAPSSDCDGRGLFQGNPGSEPLSGGIRQMSAGRVHVFNGMPASWALHGVILGADWRQSPSSPRFVEHQIPCHSVRHSSSAAAVEASATVDPSLLMHREQFLRATNRKVEKAQPVLRAYLREAPGKIPNKKERKRGLVPGIVFSGKDGHKGGGKRLVSVEYKQLASILLPLGKYFFCAMTWDLEVYEGRPGEEASSAKMVERVVPKLVHLHAATDEPLNVTFMRVYPDEMVTVDVPLVFIGEDACPGLKKGGRLNTMRRLVRYVCPGDKVPPYLEVDISRLNIGQSVLLKDLPADPTLKLAVKNPKLPVLKISGRSQETSSDGAS